MPSPRRSSPRSAHDSGCRKRADFGRPRRFQYSRTRFERRPRRCDVVYENDGAAPERPVFESVDHELADRGVIARSRSWKGLAEEQPDAYKNVDLVVEVVHKAGLAKKVARMRPIGVVKG